MNCQYFNILIKLSDFLHFNEIWLMFPPNPMYETNAIQLHFLLWFFWYISQWSGWICSIFCTRLYSKDIHCAYLHLRKQVFHSQQQARVPGVLNKEEQAGLRIHDLYVPLVILRKKMRTLITISFKAAAALHWCREWNTCFHTWRYD